MHVFFLGRIFTSNLPCVINYCTERKETSYYSSEMVTVLTTSPPESHANSRFV